MYCYIYGPVYNRENIRNSNNIRKSNLKLFHFRTENELMDNELRIRN